MLRSEFDLLSKSSKRPDDEEYKLIEFVYNWHPCNFSTEAIASLYHEFGMCIIYDMLPRANMAMEHDQAIERARNEVQNAKDRLDALMSKNIKSKEALREWLQN